MGVEVRVACDFDDVHREVRAVVRDALVVRDDILQDETELDRALACLQALDVVFLEIP